MPFTCRLFVGDDFTEELEERPVHKYITTQFMGRWGDPSTVVDLLPGTPDSTLPMFQKPLPKTGLALLSLNRNYAHISFTPEKFRAYLDLERLNDVKAVIAKTPITTDSVREKYTRYLKSLVYVGSAFGEQYKEQIGQTLEIILLQNPYTIKRGGNITARVFFRGKPLAGGSLEALCKDKKGRVIRKLLKTNAIGEVLFPLDNSGDWLVRITHMIKSTDADADWESFWSAYTFGVK